MYIDNEVDVDAYISVNDFECIELPPCNHFEIDPSHNIFKLEWWNSASQEVITRIHSLPQNGYLIFVIKVTHTNQQDLYFCCRIVREECNSTSYWGISNYLLCLKKESIDSERMANLMAQINSCGIVPYNFIFDPRNKCSNTIKVPIIEDIFYNAPYTTVKWMDETTTTVKAGKDDEFNKEYGLAMAIAKKYYECLEAPNPRAAFKKAAYKDAHDQTEKTAQKRAYKEEKKKRNKRGRISSSKKTSKR